MRNPMRISVILCTYNRCRSLARALESVAASKLSESITWEVLVVDNNSNDQTRAVVEDFCRRYPGRFRYLFDPRPGKSHALNTGIREARGDILAFTDDDVIVETTWLQNLTAGLHNGEWVGAGGRALPERTFLPPAWLSVEGPGAMAPLGLFDPGPEAGQLAESPFGNNMAFRKEMFEKYGSFRTDLGPSPDRKIPRPNEDTEFGRRLLAAGERLHYEPSAIVLHPVSENRLRKDYLLAWWFDKGRADIREFGSSTDTRWLIGGTPLYLFRRLAVWTLQWLVTLDPSARFDCRCKVWSVAGKIVECYRMSLDASAKRECDARP
jgi:glucosyl-dolichyl phosphate glucuronosyltransferase